MASNEIPAFFAAVSRSRRRGPRRGARTVTPAPFLPDSHSSRTSLEAGSTGTQMVFGM